MNLSSVPLKFAESLEELEILFIGPSWSFEPLVKLTEPLVKPCSLVGGILSVVLSESENLALDCSVASSLHELRNHPSLASKSLE